MDIIVKSQLNEFSAEFAYQNLTPEKAFEKFCNYSIYSKEYGNEPLESYEIEQTSVGDGGDNGMDGIAVIVNGKLVYTEEEINEHISRNSYLDVTFCFIQAKTSTSFVAAEIGTFLFGIKDVFSDLNEPAAHPNWNTDIQHYNNLIHHIYSNSAKMASCGLPKLKLYYVTTGQWLESHIDAKSRIERDKKELEKMGLFREISFSPIDGKEIQRLYSLTKNKVAADIKITNKITLTEINGIGQAYFGVIPFSEFKKVIMDDDNNIKNVFYDNVRAFQGLNSVNKNIDKTIKDNKIDLFPLLNNGVTIIAKSITPAGNNFTLRDYQVVNGCQTSHVLYNNGGLSEILNMQIPIRLIESQNDEVRNQIIIATNSQTEVKREQLIALSAFQKDIEKYYAAISGKGKLYYERQSKQYAGDSSIPKNKVISIPVQIISFTSMFLDEPHNVRGYYSKVLEDVEKLGKIIFSEDHKLAPYYTSGLAYHKLEELFRTGLISTEFRKAKHHLLLTFRLIAEENKRPQLNYSSIEKYCEVLNDKLLDDTQCLEIFRQACELVLNTVPNRVLLDRHINSLLSVNIGKSLNKFIQIGRRHR
jgi:hypothetical protein